MEHLEAYIDAELSNLKKSINKPRSEQNTLDKIELFNDYFQQYEALVRNKKSKSSAEISKIIDSNHNRVREKVEKALDILKNPKHETNSDVKDDNDKKSKTNNTNTAEEEKVLVLIERSTDDEIKDLKLSDQLSNLEWVSDKIDTFKDNCKNYNRLVEEIKTKVNSEYFKNILIGQNRFLEKADEAYEFLKEAEKKLIKNNVTQNQNKKPSKIIIQENTNKVQTVLGNKNYHEIQIFNFLMKLAIQCIPDFHGAINELDPFLFQIDQFASQLPYGVDEASLINVVLMKLKGRALDRTNKIRGKNWAETRENLIKEFSSVASVENILQKIETLEQGQNENFKNYKKRALNILNEISIIEQKDNIDGQFARRSLKIHFLGGLKNCNLKQLAKTQRDKNFTELLDYLDQEFIECEQIDDIERRLQACKVSKYNFQKQSNNSAYRNFSRWNDTRPDIATNWNRNHNYLPNNRNNQRPTHQTNTNQYIRQNQYQENYNRNYNNYQQKPKANQQLLPNNNSRDYPERMGQRNYQPQINETRNRYPNSQQNRIQQIPRYQNQNRQRSENYQNNRYNNNNTNSNQDNRYPKN